MNRMCNGALQKCPCYIDLQPYGIEASGCIFDTQWTKRVKIAYNSGVHSSAYENEKEYLTLVFEKSHGQHGIIEGGVLVDKKTGEQKMVYSKRPKKEGESLFEEAITQIVISNSLIRGGFIEGTPEVYRIFGLKCGGVGFLMRPVDGVVMEEMLHSFSVVPAKFVIEALFHIAAMIDWLVEDLGMNHRDLKPSNLLILFHKKMYKKRKIGNKKHTICSDFEIVFLDYGFSCIKNEISLGGIYGSDDPCVKEGRDLFMFLAFLYLEFHHKLENGIHILFEKWLTVGFCNMLRNRGKELDPVDYIYFMSGNSEIKKFICTPTKVIDDLQKFVNLSEK